ncbi:MAG: phenylacetate-CoA oxygenase subunit PaaC [Ignavibacteriae bacterium]|nr:phenylacetate-CoA oxygenase subunit PaaC [Ignavibacteriota bacterium]
MALEVPAGIPKEALQRLLVALADDELILGHRDSEWTGHAPILEEDIAFSNIAQDEIGHALVWYTINEQLGGKSPDWMGFERDWKQFTCCHFTAFPKGDFGYTVLRQYLFDVAEQVRLKNLASSSFTPMKEAAEKILLEEGYHLMHSQSLVERLGNATEESHKRMQAAAEIAFPQALGMFEVLTGEEDLVNAGAFSGNTVLKTEWVEIVAPVLASASLRIPVEKENGEITLNAKPDEGGRKGWQKEHLKRLVHDMQTVYKMSPGGSW